MNILCLTKKSNDTFELWNYTIMDLIEIDHVNKKLLTFEEYFLFSINSANFLIKFD